MKQIRVKLKNLIIFLQYKLCFDNYLLFSNDVLSGIMDAKQE